MMALVEAAGGDGVGGGGGRWREVVAMAAAGEATEGEALVVLEANAKGPIGMSIVTNFGKIERTYHLPFQGG